MFLRILFLTLFCAFAPLAESVGGFAPAHADGDGGGDSDGGESESGESEGGESESGDTDSGSDDGETDDGDSGDDGQSHDADNAARSLKSGDIMALRDLARSVTGRYPGEIIGTEFKTKKNVPIYEFYILQKNGRVREVKVNAKTGRILK